jgi:hypothetical protein
MGPKLRGVRVFPLLLGILCGPGASHSTPLQRPTQRLRLQIDRATLRVGETARLRVEFLDRDFQPVANDRIRLVEFAQLPAGPGQPGSGVFSASRISIPRGARSDTTVAFRASGSGKVLLQATAPDLVPAQTLVFISPQGSSVIQPSESPTFHLAAYQQDITVEIDPRGFNSISANGVSRAQFWVSLNRPLMSGEQVHVIVKSYPGVRVLYQGTERLGITDITISGGAALSEELDVLAAEPGTVRIVAQVVPNGPRDEVEVRFDPPRPQRVILEASEDTIPSRQRTVVLAVKLADQDRVLLSELARTWEIHLSSPTDPRVTEFDPETLSLTPDRPVGRSTLKFKELPAANDILLRAMDLGGTLDPAEHTLTLTGLLHETPGFILVLFAGLGGILGGLARDVYRRRIRQILPQWSAGYLHLGLVGNVAFSFLFGYVLYQAATLGLIGFRNLSGISATKGFAFLFGLLGGFGGISVLDQLLDQIFPERKTGERARSKSNPSAPGT